jgi:hypothetical protein
MSILIFGKYRRAVNGEPGDGSKTIFPLSPSVMKFSSSAILQLGTVLLMHLYRLNFWPFYIYIYFSFLTEVFLDFLFLSVSPCFSSLFVLFPRK